LEWSGTELELKSGTGAGFRRVSRPSSLAGRP
jgi:hypothetical protein